MNSEQTVRDLKNAYMREYREKNSKKQKEYMKQYRLKNKSKIEGYRQSYWKRKLEKLNREG